MKASVNNYIGTSGWLYTHWVGTFYPVDTKPKELFHYYATQFCTVELNTTFYHLPKRTTVDRWKTNAPRGFVYSVKASRFITHIKRFLDPKESVRRFIEGIAPLKESLGPILFQTPPRFPCDVERLSTLLKALPKKYNYTFEFRHRSWFKDEVYTLLRKYNAALCIYDLSGYTSPQIVTADFTYIRLHGPRAAYRDSYSDEKLAEWAAFIRTQNGKGVSVYAYFDNDIGGHAPRNAKTLQALMV